jgi:NAD+ diphosphatase
LMSDFPTVTDITPVGFLNDKPVFACSVETANMDVMKYTSGNLFALIGRIAGEQFDVIGRAYQLLCWERDHRHCGRCGEETSLADKGQSRACEPCGLSVYPRLSPCVIVLVTRDEELLLAAGAGANRRFYSCLAGFVEPGETCEQAVQREVMEEVGVEVDDIQYHGSQPWPFPGQLMLGFTAKWRSGDINIDPEEIDEAIWCTADNLPPVPPPFSIAGQLINGFLKTLS